MKTKSFTIFIYLFFLAACDNFMKTELDVTSTSFPPKLSVSAILDGGNGSLSIGFTEGRPLADYSRPIAINRKIIRNGEIRLYEDNKLIWSKPGPFDMSIKASWYDPVQKIGEQDQNGYYHVEQGIVTRPGSRYRLEVEVEGYETAVSSSIMPAAPVVSANIDEAAAKKFNNVRRVGSLHVLTHHFGIEQFLPVTIQFEDTNPDVRKYFVLYGYMETTEYYDSYLYGRYDYLYGIGVTDLSKLQDNPDVETQDLLMEMGLGTEPTDLYNFNMLIQSNLTFSKGNNSLNIYAQYCMRYFEDNPYLEDNPDVARITLYDRFSLRVKQITAETFRYYRSVALQTSGVGFFTEPVNIVGNIENGYGGFSVCNSVNFPMLELESCYYMNR